VSNQHSLKNSQIKSNFNLSFNNSFNTSFGTGAQQSTSKNIAVPKTTEHSTENSLSVEQKPEVSFTAEAENSQGQKLISHGKFTVDVEQLEE